MMYWGRTKLLILLLTIAIHSSKGEDDEALVENTDEEHTAKVEVDTVPYVTPDIDPSVYFAEHFDSEEAFEQKWIKSSAKKEGVESSIDR